MLSFRAVVSDLLRASMAKSLGPAPATVTGNDGGRTSITEAIMVSDPYPVTMIELKWAREQENMGSKPKFWYTDDNGRRWLFKLPRPGTGEHWAEKIAAEIAAALDIAHASVELAQFNERRGSATESFTRHRPRHLYHGNQLLARIFSNNYDPDKTFQNSSHTLRNVWLALDRVFRKISNRAKEIIAEYLVLDALIGNTDRHHENWALLRRPMANRWKWFVAPSYDHASSLGRELTDERRNRLLAEKRVGRYSEKAKGGIYWSEGDRRAPSPLELVRRAHEHYPALFARALEKLEKLRDDTMMDNVNRVPEDWMTPSARTFALELMRYNMSELRKLGL